MSNVWYNKGMIQDSKSLSEQMWGPEWQKWVGEIGENIMEERCAKVGLLGKGEDLYYNRQEREIDGMPWRDGERKFN